MTTPVRPPSKAGIGGAACLSEPFPVPSSSPPFVPLASYNFPLHFLPPCLPLWRLWVFSRVGRGFFLFPLPGAGMLPHLAAFAIIVNTANLYVQVSP